MDCQKFIAEREWIRDQLKDVADFWLENGIDQVHGGVYTCLDRTGKIFSTDKSVWMQGRCASAVTATPRPSTASPMQNTTASLVKKSTWNVPAVLTTCTGT